jgi:hypothetical protein
MSDKPIRLDENGQPWQPDWQAAQERARAAYRDDSYPERACDHCGKPYRGPAVFCSLECAIAAAR